MIEFNKNGNPTVSPENFLNVMANFDFYQREARKHPNCPLNKQALEIFRGYLNYIKAHKNFIIRYIAPHSPIPPKNETKIYTMTGFDKIEITPEGKTKLPDPQQTKPLPITRSIKEKTILKPRWSEL